MKKRLLLLTILALILSACLVLSSCDKPNTDEGKEPSTAEYVTVTFDTNGGSAIDSVQVIKGEKVAKPQDPQREGYTFDGWYIDGEKWSFVGYTVTENMTLTAKWTPIMLTVTFDTNGGSTIDSVQIQMGEKVAKPQDPQKEGYTFDGWYIDGEKWSFIGYVVTENMTLTAKWTKEEVQEPTPEYVTVIFDTQGGSAIDSVQVGIGKRVTPPQAPQREGYTFDGWYFGDEKWSFVSYTITENMTLTAKWVPITYTITYVGNVIHSNKATYTVEDETFDLDGTANEEYYEFLGWYEDEEFTKQVTKIEKGTTGNKTLYAKTEYTPLLFRLMEDDYAVVSCDADVTSVVIPSTYKGKSVTSIGELAFHNRTKLTSIEIPNSVTSIGDYAFQNCNSLTSIEIPNSVTTIGKRVFVGCISLTSVEMPNSVTSIGESAFENCTSLISIELPNSVTTIGDSAFKGCTDLAGVEISNNLTSIGRWVFSNCTSLTSVKIPNSITSIGYGAFSDCTGLTSVEIPSNVTSIDSSAFQGCTDLTSVAIGAGVTSIGYGAFLGCVSLTNINIPNSVTSIAERAFYKCISLTSIEIPTGITSIADYVFYGCAGLTDIEIPNSVTSIGDHAFEGCQGLTSVNIPNSITSIGESAFKDCIGLTGISIPNSVTSIRGGVFSGCTGIAYNEYDNGLYLGNEENPYLILISAKDNSITSCEINEKTRIIQDGAFQGCTALASIIIPNSVGSVGYGAFYNCNSLTIYCEAESRPKEWSGYWNASSCPVVWGYKQGE